MGHTAANEVAVTSFERKHVKGKVVSNIFIEPFAIAPFSLVEIHQRF